jgi:hypothetical protein
LPHPVKSYGVWYGVINLAVTCLLAKWLASYRGQELYLGSLMELGNLHSDVSLLIKLPMMDSPTDKGKGTTGAP